MAVRSFAMLNHLRCWVQNTKASPSSVRSKYDALPVGRDMPNEEKSVFERRGEPEWKPSLYAAVGSRIVEVVQSSKLHPNVD